jgi:hypothetical protein
MTDEDRMTSPLSTYPYPQPISVVAIMAGALLLETMILAPRGI